MPTYWRGQMKRNEDIKLTEIDKHVVNINHWDETIERRLLKAATATIDARELYRRRMWLLERLKPHDEVLTRTQKYYLSLIVKTGKGTVEIARMAQVTPEAVSHMKRMICERLREALKETS